MQNVATLFDWFIIKKDTFLIKTVQIFKFIFMGVKTSKVLGGEMTRGETWL